MTTALVVLVAVLLGQLGLLELVERSRVTIKLPGRWYVHYNPEGRAKPPNKDGHYDFRGQKVHFTRVTTA